MTCVFVPYGQFYILRFYIKSLNKSNVGITRDLEV